MVKLKKYFVIILSIGALIHLTGCAAQAPYLKLDSSLQKDIRTFSGVEFVPLIKLCDTYRLNYNWDSFIKTAVLEKNGKKIVLRAGSDRILVNGEESRMERPALIDDNTVYVPISFVRSRLGAVAGTALLERPEGPVVSKKVSIDTITIDPGHGGKDAGATGKKLHLKEKGIALSVAKRLKGILEGHGIRVVMTRDDDRFIPLSKRVQLANNSGSDLFVSIHINASRTRSLKGFECYYLSTAADDNARALEASENSSLEMPEGTMLGHSHALDKTLWDMMLTEYRAESTGLAGHICKSVGDSLAIKNRGIRSARFYVLKGTRMPAVLVELGYLSNRYEEMKLKDDKFLDTMTDAVAQGILAYKQEYESTEGYTNI